MNVKSTGVISKITFSGCDRSELAEKWIKENPDKHVKQYEFHNGFMTLYFQEDEDLKFYESNE